MNEDNVRVDPSIFKAYDVRGIYGQNLTESVAYRIGRAAAQYLNVPEIAVGRDMRTSSPQLADSLLHGIVDQGVNAIDLGMTTTDGLYFAVGKFNYPAGVMITASHNPAQYNGMKFCRAQAFPISLETGLSDIRDLAIRGEFPEPARKGQVTRRDVTDAYVEHALSFIDVSKVRPLKVVIDAGNGMAGMIMPRVFKHLPCTLVPLYFELDGNFPNHPASPIEPENMRDLQNKVREVGADLGAAFDGDADRMFPVDELGNVIDGSMVTALMAQSLLRKHPGSTILYNLIVSKSVPALVQGIGVTAVRTRVGHSYIKAEMRRLHAIFGGELEHEAGRPQRLAEGRRLGAGLGREVARWGLTPAQSTEVFVHFKMMVTDLLAAPPLGASGQIRSMRDADAFLGEVLQAMMEAYEQERPERSHEPA